jgi:hypothetical protein
MFLLHIFVYFYCTHFTSVGFTLYKKGINWKEKRLNTNLLFIVTATSLMSHQRCNIVTTSSFMSQQRYNNVTTSSFMSQNVWPMFTSLIQTKSSITLQINILSIIFRSFFRGFHSKEIVETIQFEGMSTVVIRPCQLKPL